MSNGTNAAMGAETTSGTGSVFSYGKDALLSVEAGIAGAGTWTWEALRERPYAGVVIGGGLGFGAAVLLGVAELAVTVLTAYAGYRILAYNETLVEAFEKSLMFRSGELLEEIEEEKKEREQEEQEPGLTEKRVRQSTAATVERPGSRSASKPARNRKA